jgi:superfamily II DNA or RNA helicase
MEHLTIKKINEVYVRVESTSAVHQELSEFFKFRVPGYQFMPAYKMRVWDGYIRLFNIMDRTIYSGLLNYIKVFCDARGYTWSIDPSLESIHPWLKEDVNKLTKSLKLPFAVREYQTTAIHHAVKHQRALLVSPTGSGKSVLIYAMVRHYNRKTLIIVPTISLVSQMLADFKDYSAKDKSFDVDKMCHGIYAGKNKTSDKFIIVSTWQSIYKMPKKFFKDFEVVFGDEVHLFKAQSLKKIMENLVNAKYRFGTTGTLDGLQTNKLILEGLFGKVFKVTTTKNLMNDKHLAELSIKCLVLKYPEATSKANKILKYQDEIKFLVLNKRRNIFIRNLAVSMKSNTLVLFQFVESHGKILHELIKTKVAKTDPQRNVFFVSGKTEGQLREEIRKITDTQKNAIIVASSGVFSTGINIKNLNNIIFASPTKSRIRTLQSIGRALRIGESDQATLYDIADDMVHKGYKNFAIKHFLERVKIYDAEKFKYSLHQIDLG